MNINIVTQTEVCATEKYSFKEGKSICLLRFLNLDRRRQNGDTGELED